MNIDLKTLPDQFKVYAKKLMRHMKFIFIIAILAVSSFLVFEINNLTNQEPSQEQITEQQEIIKRPRIDQETIDKIEQLEDQNIAVQSLFKTARDNPFQD